MSNTMQQPRSTMASAVRAGQQAGQNYVDIHRETNKYANKPAEINKVAYKAQMAEKRVATEIDARAKKSEITTKNYLDRTDVTVQAYKDKQKAEKGQRKAGILAGIGMLASDMITENKLGDAPRMERPDSSAMDKYAQYLKDDQAKREATEANRVYKTYDEKYGELTGKNTSTSTPTSPSSSNASNSVSTAALNSSAAPGTLSGTKKEFADAIAGPESGSWGYEAFNQGGAAAGTKVLGKSGSYKETYGRSLTDMTLGEIYHKQNTKQRGLSLDEHFKSGGLHAVGRYQFIGDTLQDEAKRMGLSPDTKFTPEVQDSIFFSHAKRVGNISPWVGPSVKYDAAERARLNNMISTF